MRLKTGIYDKLINRELEKDIKDSELSGLICKKEAIDTAEVPKMIANYLSNVVRKKIEDGELDKDNLSDVVNKTIKSIEDQQNDREELTTAKEKLSAVISTAQKAQLDLTKGTITLPLSGFSVSNLFTGGQSPISLNEEIKRDIASADEICLIVSFLKMSGVRIIKDELAKFCFDDKHRLRIITTTYCGVTEGKAVQMLSELPNTEIKISYNTKIERLHAKAYIFLRDTGYSTAYIGSSNLSHSAQTDGLEWNIRVTNVENPHIIKTALATFNSYWNSPNFENFVYEKFKEVIQKEKQPRDSSAEIYQKYNLQVHQKIILNKIKLEREDFGNYRNLIVAATGTGKTVVSAFDYKNFCLNNKSSHKLLFVAHRVEILKQSRATYRSVLCDYNFGDIMAGSFEPTKVDFLFVSVQSLNSHLETFQQLGPNYYDYIVIDEAHHMTASSYQKIIQYFRPKVLLGLTATPERMDGVSLLPDFNNKITAEIRLPQALNDGLLTPFQYLCIKDPTDISDDSLWLGNKYITSKLAEKLCNQDRAGLVMRKLIEYLPDEHKCRALCFCCNKEHAMFMSNEFNKHGFKSEYLISDNNDAHRISVNKKLAEGIINYLFVVDIFNEGVDIPEVDTVLFLRPTESLTIFLQQLGRGLRLSVGKDCLTVLDFVAQVNKNYDFTSRFRSLLTKPDKNIEEQVKSGFTCLPHGCSIYMEEKAQEIVLENITNAIYNIARLRRELSGFTNTPTLSEFLSSIGQDIRLIYRNGNCWSTLKADAGKCEKITDDGIIKRLKKGMGNLIHINSLDYMKFIISFLDSGCSLPDIQKEKEKVFSVMLYYALFQDKLSRLGFNSINEALTNLKRYPIFITEIREIIDYLKDKRETQTLSIGDGMPLALELYGCYTREEIFTIFGIQTPGKKMQGSVSGVFNIESLNTELFFVTLNKSDKDFSPSTQYDDYVVSEDIFHWQSQNNDSHNNKGSRFVNQRGNGKKFVLFVRENKKDGYGNTCPFYCFGLIDYISSRGDYPMNIDWRLRKPALPQFLKIV